MTGDLISREAAMQLARNHIGHTIDINDIARLPAVDAVPVVHGRWTFPWTSPECSVCKKTQKWTSKYCPNCGAMMRGESDEAE